MRVALLPTGRTEWHGLSDALRRLFPSHDFYVLPEELVFHSTGPFDGFTSFSLTAKHEGEYLPENATNLVGRAAQEALGDGSRREPADAVVVLDDLELANRQQPDRVVRVSGRPSSSTSMACRARAGGRKRCFDSASRSTSLSP
jgi:hypothetical protein